MIQLTPHMRILLAVQAADFRKGIDGLARICRETLPSAPFGGAVYVFRNRRGTAHKLLVHDGQGFWLCPKRLSRGRFAWWPTDDQVGSFQLGVHDLQLLLGSGDPASARAAPAWRPVPVTGRPSRQSPYRLLVN